MQFYLFFQTIGNAKRREKNAKWVRSRRILDLKKIYTLKKCNKNKSCKGSCQIRMGVTIYFFDENN